MLTFWVVLHVLFAIVLFGPSFAMPFIGIVAQKGGDPKTALRITSEIVKKALLPADVLMPLTGTLIILSSNGAYNPFEESGRWLLSAIVIYAALVLIANLVQVPTLKKALALADEGRAGTPEFGVLMGKMKKVGPILGLMVIAIAILMVWKPAV